MRGWGKKFPLEKIEPTEALDVFSNKGIRLEKDSLLEMNSCRRSEDDEDGAKVATENPIG